MPDSSTLLEGLSKDFQKQHKKNKVILTFAEFTSLVQKEPSQFIRNSWQYIVDTLDHFGSQAINVGGLEQTTRYKIFDLGTEDNIPIIGGELAQSEIYNTLKGFNNSTQSSKLILLHGPNGSAKSSTVETIANGMQQYSQKDEGAIYRFNWIFPADRESLPQSRGDSGTIGFGSKQPSDAKASESYALLDDNKIASKLTSEYKENPLFLIPMPYREKWLREWMAQANSCSPDDVYLPPHILENGLSKRNHEIFENLLNVYGGSLSKVYRHIQIERLYYSKQYRVGLSTVEPQMSVDAREKQLTLDKNFSNLPTVLHTISFYQSEGELVDANRGILEFSDLLKRPLEAYKYLLGTIEKNAINLSSGKANLDITFFATTNEKHLDSFKTIPDFSSFKGRMELITVPYLLLPSREEGIYAKDIETISLVKPVSPHSLEYLCLWAVMTRLKQPEPSKYPEKFRALVSRLTPYLKVMLFEGKPLQPEFTIEEQNALSEIRQQVWHESQGMVVYEGRFGASPREVRSLLHKAANNKRQSTITPVLIFNELEKLTKDRTIYEFLQFEPRGQYHNAALFIDILRGKFAQTFELEIIDSMSMAESGQYDSLLRRYVEHVVAQIKGEKVFDAGSNSYQQPSLSLMNDLEQILEIEKDASSHRNALLSRIAAYKLENPENEIDVSAVFYDYLEKIKKHYYEEKRAIIESSLQTILTISKEGERGLTENQNSQSEMTLRNMEQRYGYTREATIECLKFLLVRKHNLEKSAKTSSLSTPHGPQVNNGERPA